MVLSGKSPSILTCCPQPHLHWEMVLKHREYSGPWSCLREVSKSCQHKAPSFLILLLPLGQLLCQTWEILKALSYLPGPGGFTGHGATIYS